MNAVVVDLDMTRESTSRPNFMVLCILMTMLSFSTRKKHPAQFLVHFCHYLNNRTMQISCFDKLGNVVRNSFQ